MQDIEELQRQITQAMERVAVGVEKIGAKDKETIAELQQDLQNEQLKVEALTQRLADQTKETETAKAALEAQNVAALNYEKLDHELQQLRQSNEALGATNQALREASQTQRVEPDLINQSLAQELDALKIARASEVAEGRAIIDALTPLLQQTSEGS